MFLISKESFKYCTYLFQVQKPLVEKKRRDRINQALDEMKDLVLSSLRSNKNVSMSVSYEQIM